MKYEKRLKRLEDITYNKILENYVASFQIPPDGEFLINPIDSFAIQLERIDKGEIPEMLKQFTKEELRSNDLKKFLLSRLREILVDKKRRRRTKSRYLDPLDFQSMQ